MFGRDHTDQRFAHYCRTGDPDALADVFDRTAGRLMRVALWLVGNPPDAEDLLQRTFLQAIEARAQFEHGRPVLPWLLGLLGNQARKLRSERQRATVRPAPADRVVDAAVEAAERELEQAVSAVRERLGAPYSEVLRLHLEEGLNGKEVAERLARPAGTVRTQLVRALEQLRRQLPGGFVAGLAALAVVDGAAIAAVRVGVLAAARAVATPAAVGGLVVTTTTIGGLLMAKKFLLAVPLLLLFGVLVWSVLRPSWSESPQVPAAPLATAEVGDAVMGVKEPAAATPFAEERVLALPVESAVPGPVPLTPAPSATTVVVIVVGPDGVPLDGIGASVAYLGMPAQRWRGTTDQRGEWHLTVAGGGPATVALDCGPSRDLTLREAEAHRIAFELPATTEVRGRVLDAHGAPIVGATLLLARPATTEQNILPEAVSTTDATGHYHVRHLVPQARLGARARGFAASPLFVVGPKGDWPRPFDIVLVAGGARIEGRVLDVDGAPITDAMIQVTTKARRLGIPGERGGPYATMGSQVRCQPTSEGTFAIDGVEPGQARLLAWSPRHGRQVVDLVLVAGETVVVSPMLSLGASLAGHVRDTAGQPIADAQVLCGTGMFDDAVLPTTRSNPEGGFHVAGLPAGEILVRARSSGMLDGRSKVRLVEGQTATVQFGLLPAPQLVGCVLDVDGAPARNATVGARDPDSRVPVSGFQRVDGNGRFVLPCTKEGATALWVQRDGMEVEVVAMTTNCPAVDLVVRLADRAGSPASVRGSLHGNGGPLPYQGLFLLTSDGRRRQADVTGPGSGSFSTVVPPGSYELRTRVGGVDGKEVSLASFVVAAGQEVDLGVVVMPLQDAKAPR